jgi:PAS domain S-box-containing protein
MDQELITVLENKLRIIEKEKALLLSKIEQLKNSSNENKVFYNIYDLYTKSFNTSAIPKSHFDINGNYLKVNAAFCDFFELTEEEIIGKSFLQFTHPDNMEMSNQYFQNLLSGKIISIDIEKKYLIRSDNIKWGHVFVEPFYNSKKQLAFFISQILDITDKKEAEIAISNSYNAFGSILDNMDNLVFITDLSNHTIKFTNNKTKSLLGNVIGKKCFEILNSENKGPCIFCDSDKQDFDKLSSIVKTRESYNDITQRWYNITERVIKWIDGTFCRLVISNDISAQKELLNQISDSEKRFKALSDSSFEAIFISENGYYIEVNKVACDLLEYSYEELVGKFGPDIFSEECREKVKQFTLSGYEEHYEAIAITKNNLRLNVEIRGKTFQYMGRQVRVAALRDITERKKAIETIKQSEERYRNLFETSPEPIVIHIDGKVIDVNKSAMDFFGAKSIDKLLDRNALDFVHPDYKKIVIERIKNINRDGVSGELIEEKFITLNNETRDVEVSVVPVLFNDNFASQVFFRDITERKNVENALKESEEKFKNIADTAFDGIVLMDQNGNIAFWNKAAEKILGYSVDEILGKNLHQICLPESKYILKKSDFEELNEPSFKKFNGRNFITGIKRKDNTFVTVEISITSFKSRGKWNAVGIIRDITKRLDDEKALRESEQKLRELNATKDKFFSIIAHDLKNPFNQLIGFTDLLLINIRDYTLTEIEEFIQLLNKSAKNGYRLLENLLEWSRTQTNKKYFNPEKFFIKELLLKNIDLLQNNAQTKNIDIEVHIKDDVSVLADYNMILTVLRNLISNSIKFTRINGKIKILTNQFENQLQISISDNGIGISEEDQNKLFKIDIHHSTKGTNNEGGTGLGLILCKEFITMNSGNIWVESKLNEGSTFYFTIPIAKKQ